MNTITSQLTKKRLTVLTAICSAGFFLAACEPTAEEQSSEPITPVEQDGAATYGQPNRDLQEDPAMQNSTRDTTVEPLDSTGDTTIVEPMEAPPAPSDSSATEQSTDDSVDTAF